MIYQTKRMPKLIVVDADGDIITAANGQLSSNNQELVRIIKREVLFRRKVQLIAPFGKKVRANLQPEDLIGITAALFSARPGRTKLLEAPAEVWEWFKEASAEASCGGNTSSGKDFKFKEMTDSDVEATLLYFSAKKETQGDK
jgi:hypothetical protein